MKEKDVEQALEALEALKEGNIAFVVSFLKENGFDVKSLPNVMLLVERFNWIEQITYPLGYRNELAFFFKQSLYTDDMENAIRSTRSLIRSIGEGTKQRISTPRDVK